VLKYVVRTDVKWFCSFIRVFALWHFRFESAHPCTRHYAGRLSLISLIIKAMAVFELLLNAPRGLLSVIICEMTRLLAQARTLRLAEYIPIFQGYAEANPAPSERTSKSAITISIVVSAGACGANVDAKVPILSCMSDFASPIAMLISWWICCCQKNAKWSNK
jgi:hypothetical protein